MFPSAGDELEVKWGGVLVASVGFVLTRVLLVDAVYGISGNSPVLAVLQLVPLVLGLGLVVYGVNLAVSTRDRDYARTVAGWFLLGSLGMVLVVGVVVVSSGEPLIELRTSGVVASAVVGGGVGGVLVGARSARNRRQRRQLAQQTDQTVLLNRLLRHEVLNAVTAIRGHAGLLADGDGGERSRAAVEDNTERIERTVEEVGFIVRTTDDAATALDSVDLGAVLERCRERLLDGGTVVDVDIDDDLFPVQVRADDHLDTVVAELVTMATERVDPEDGNAPRLDVTTGPTTVALSVSASGSWLDDAERSALLDGLPEYDSPDVGYGVSIVRLLVGQYGGSVDVIDDEAGTTVEVELLRTGEDAPPTDSPGVGTATLRNVTVSGLVAGVVMGLVLQSFAGEIAIIGALYGVRTVVVGWITHLFHSVVFATLFAAVLSRSSVRRYADSLPGTVALGLGYGLLLWVVAGGIVMGLWLNAVGLPSPIPDLGLPGLLGHVVWGLSLGGIFGLLPGEERRDAGDAEPGRYSERQSARHSERQSARHSERQSIRRSERQARGVGPRSAAERQEQ